MNDDKEEEEDWTLYEFQLYDTEGEFLFRLACIPPFEVAPWVAIHEDRYFVLMEDLTYHEAPGVHFLPKIQQLQEVVSANSEANHG